MRFQKLIMAMCIAVGAVFISTNSARAQPCAGIVIVNYTECIVVLDITLRCPGGGFLVEEHFINPSIHEDPLNNPSFTQIYNPNKRIIGVAMFDVLPEDCDVTLIMDWQNCIGYLIP